MPKHLKSKMINDLQNTIAESIQIPDSPHVRGVRYCTLVDAVEKFHGAVNTRKQAQHYHKNIILRPSRHHPGNELYTLHFPKAWSAACVTNREIIKEAQRRAHAIERDPVAAMEWKILFLKQLYNPVPDKKVYPNFYPFVYVTIYRALRAEKQLLDQPLAIPLVCLAAHARAIPLRTMPPTIRIAA